MFVILCFVLYLRVPSGVSLYTVNRQTRT